MRIILFLCLSFLLPSCANVTVRPDGGQRVSSNADVSESTDFFLWGLTPESVDVVLANHCGGATPKQFQAQTTFIDGLLGAITLGIYSPRSYRVWCR